MGDRKTGVIEHIVVYDRAPRYNEKDGVKSSYCGYTITIDGDKFNGTVGEKNGKYTPVGKSMIPLKVGSKISFTYNVNGNYKNIDGKKGVLMFDQKVGASDIKSSVDTILASTEMSARLADLLIENGTMARKTDEFLKDLIKRFHPSFVDVHVQRQIAIVKELIKNMQ